MYYGSRNEDCNVEGGQCECKTNYAGRTCEECHDGYYNYPDCDSKCLIMKIVCLDTPQICGKKFIPHLTNFLVFLYIRKSMYYLITKEGEGQKMAIFDYVQY